jgi:hypothetical protein
MQITMAMLLGCLYLQMSCRAVEEPGTTNTTFNRRFIPTIKPMMTYEEIEKIAGAPGVKIGENKNASPPEVQYRWNGSKDSILTVKFVDNRMIEATVLAPNRHTYLIQKNGEVSDSTK